MLISPLKLVAIAGALGALFALPVVALAAGSSTVHLSVAQVYNMTATNSANLAIGDSNYDTLGNYNFVSLTSGTYGQVKVNSNTPWSIRARVNANLPTGPGGGYTLKVDDDRSQWDTTGWSGPLTTSNQELNFASEGTAGSFTYNLDWRIEGLTEEDGSAGASRTVTFTISAP